MICYRNGDLQAFAKLYGRHKAPLFRYICRQCRGRSVSEELFQDVWTSLIGAAARYRVDAKFTTFLYSIARNRLIDYHRSNKRTPQANEAPDQVDAIPSSVPEPSEIIDGQRRYQRLLGALNELPAEQRDAFLLREEGGMSLADIAKTMGVSSETAKSRLRYAVKKLQKSLEN